VNEGESSTLMAIEANYGVMKTCGLTSRCFPYWEKWVILMSRICVIQYEVVQCWRKGCVNLLMMLVHCIWSKLRSSVVKSICMSFTQYV